MTVVAYRSGIMAADSCVTDEGVSVGDVRKIVRVRGGGLAGAAGCVATMASFLPWAQRGFPKRSRPDVFEDKEFIGIFVKPDGSVWFYEDSMEPYRVDAKMHAIGSGSVAALAAMHAGADPIKAARIATRLVQNCREPIISLKLEP